MYSVLLVDDEKLIRDGVCELLSMANLDLDLTTAASAVEALAVLDQRKIDIIVMDIRMPQMSGLELYDLVLEKWPHCKMVFLTGHMEFDYVYKVHQHARYVLKAEEDEKLVQAVRESIEEIEHDLLLERAGKDESWRQRLSRYYERTLLMKELVDSSAGSSPIPLDALKQMDLDLRIDLDSDVYCVLIRCVALGELDYRRRISALEGIGLLIDKFYLELFDGTWFNYNKNMTYLLLQPKKNLLRPEKTLEGFSETFQKAVSRNMGLDVSIFVHETPLSFTDAIRDFQAFRDRMFSMTEDEICLGNLRQIGVLGNSNLPEPARQELSRKVRLLEEELEDLNRAGVLELLRELEADVRSVKSMHDLLVMELYYSVCTKVLGYAKKSGLGEETTYQIGITGLYDVSKYTSWPEVFKNLRRVVELAFQNVDSSIENKNEDAVSQVKAYIAENLDGDTSLYALSTHVHLCQEHLLWVFKKQEGVTILQYINDLKLAKAKQLLTETDVQVKDIAVRLGFTSAGYFGRFFKSKLGVTPNAYREQKGKIKE